MYKDIYSTIYPLSDGAAIPTIAIYSGYDYQGVYCQVGWLEMLIVIALGRLFFSEVLRFVAYIYERENTLTGALFFCHARSICVGVILLAD